MSDIADNAQPEEEAFLAQAIARHSKPLAKGVQGYCDLCGEWSGRLVLGACAPCRDRHGLG